MLTLIIGGSGSGKSEYAENYVLAHAQGRKKYYIATMQVYDEEGKKRVKRHRMMRQGKGFETIEQQTRIEDASRQMEKSGIVLLECLSNLVANEMFSETDVEAADVVISRIASGLRQLQKGTKHLVIVSNNVFEDGIVYDETTMEYIRAMGVINQKIAEMAEEVVEVVVGIPIPVK